MPDNDDDLRRKSFEVGDHVEARYRRGSKWERGKIRAINSDGTFDVRYEDGKEDLDLRPSDIRIAASHSPLSPRRKYIRDEPTRREQSDVLISREFSRILRDLGKRIHRAHIDTSPRQLFLDVDKDEKGYMSRKDFKGCLAALVETAESHQAFDDIFPSK